MPRSVCGLPKQTDDFIAPEACLANRHAQKLKPLLARLVQLLLHGRGFCGGE